MADNGQELRLPRIISDGMFLQRDAGAKLWGWAEPGREVTVVLRNKTYSTITIADGTWSLELPALEAGGPLTLTVRSGARTVTLSDVWIGDVWLCSGQSNMQLTMDWVKDRFASDIPKECRPGIRQFTVPDRYSFGGAEEDLEGGVWKEATPENVFHFSAVGYYFACRVFEETGVPVGLIQTAVGGTPVEAWMSEEALGPYPELLEEAARFRDKAGTEELRLREEKAVSDWYRELNERDAGLTEGAPWWKAELDDSDWETVRLPGDFEEWGLRSFCGSVWLRRTVRLSADMAGAPARIRLGTIVDGDATYVNGQQVGTTGFQYPQRCYDIPAGLLKEGDNGIVIRAVSHNGQGRVTREKPFELEVRGERIPLAGPWRLRMGASCGPQPGLTFVASKPTGLFNGMIAPIRACGIKGILWYQGESNAAHPQGYEERFKGLIRDWRSQWKQQSLPFLFVQLANFMEAKRDPCDSEWAELREAQGKALELPGTGMAVAIDAGEWNDIHPMNKKVIGQRLALAALKVAYGRELVHSGPVFREMKVEGSRAVLTFDHTGSGLATAGGGAPGAFAVAGEDRVFVWARAEIRDDRVEVWSEEVPHPAAVRYAWADNPVEANLYNREGLPASPFRTDDW